MAGAADQLLIAVLQNRPLSRKTRYVELYVVTDSREVPWAGGCAGGGEPSMGC